MEFKRGGDLCPRKMRTIVMKNAKGKAKNKDKVIKPKIINDFLSFTFITLCSYKPREIVNNYQNITPAGHFTERPNMSNLVHPNHSPRCKTEDRLKVGINPHWSIKLAGLTSLIKLFYISNLSGPIPLALYFVKCKMVCKMPVIIMRLFEDRENIMEEKTLSSLTNSLNIEKVMVGNSIFGASWFNRSFFGGTQVVKS